MKKLMLLALVATMPMALVAADAAPEAPAAPADAEVAKNVNKPVTDMRFKANIDPLKKKFVKHYDVNLNTTTGVKARVSNFKAGHPRLFWTGVAVLGAGAVGLVGWIVNKFVLSKKEKAAELPAEVQAQLDAENLMKKPAAKAKKA
jgi:hypothetical protein